MEDGSSAEEADVSVDPLLGLGLTCVKRLLNRRKQLV